METCLLSQKANKLAATGAYLRLPAIWHTSRFTETEIES